MATPLETSGTAVAGYFATGHEAHRAINALIDNGFRADEIGAAFHVGSGAPAEQAATRDPNVGGSLREDLGTTMPGKTTDSNSLSGASSGSNAVQFGNLGPGSGTVFDGAGRPGPIPGSDLGNSGLPSELASGLPHDSDVKAGRAGNWSQHLEPVFGRGSRHDVAKHDKGMAGEQAKESEKFGTGEGSLNLSAPRSYSHEGFERSFSGYGIESTHARHLSHRIGHGGAVVTVHSATRAADAERILEQHGGQVRYSPGSAAETPAGSGEVEVFGTIGRDYRS